MRLMTAACLVAALSCTAARADLQPGEIAILAVRSSEKSRELAEYYAKARDIPPSQICLLDVAPGERLSRADWETKVRPEIRRWLAESKLDDRVRCLVTVWDMPPTIGQIDTSSPAQVRLKAHLESQRVLRRQRLIDIAGEIDDLPRGSKKRRQREPPAADADTKACAEWIGAVLADAQTRFTASGANKSPEFAKSVREFEQQFFRLSGASAIVQSLETQLKSSRQPPPDNVRNFDVRRGELTGLRLGLTILSAFPESIESDQQMLIMIQQTDGLLGTMAFIDQLLELRGKNESYASFDSELALLHFEAYPVVRWQNSALQATFDPLSRDLLPRTLMVARLEAPTFDEAKGLIDSAIETEKQGLTGKVYIDARGIKADKVVAPGSDADYDQSLRDLAQLLENHATLPVVLDNRDELFQKGACPDAALYCGWYSLGKYVDAFTWKRGAIGYHLASSEAVNLRNAGSQAWCNQMLEHGVAGTLGPTFEPYLQAFPRPLEFFSQLLTGKYTLGEVYARTNPFNSWVMVLVGDPLYNPFRNHPQLDAAELPQFIEELVKARSTKGP